ncbi:MAG: 50S ribosomal protein L15 [Mucinivorans sp.]
MNLSTLKSAAGSTHSEKRIGRGQGSGHGGTSTRGHKGAKSRSGYSQKRGFEGGQMPLHRRLPKFGFTNINKISNKAINLDTLEALAAKGITTITTEQLYTAGLISHGDQVKILGKGVLNAKIEVSAPKFSASAIAAIEKAGGSATVI